MYDENQRNQDEWIGLYYQGHFPSDQQPMMVWVAMTRNGESIMAPALAAAWDAVFGWMHGKRRAQAAARKSVTAPVPIEAPVAELPVSFEAEPGGQAPRAA